MAPPLRVDSPVSCAPAPGQGVCVFEQAEWEAAGKDATTHARDELKATLEARAAAPRRSASPARRIATRRCVHTRSAGMG